MKVKQVGFLLGAAFVLAGCAGSEQAAPRQAGSAAKPCTRSSAVAALAASAAGWRTDFCRHVVPLSEFQSGGPGKDGIPALTHPQFAPVTATRYLKPKEPVIELVVRGQARAYPLQILIWHEIADDTVASIPVAVTFCPLCNTAIVFDRRVGRKTLSFGTTGNLRNSDLVMYDRQTESWWQQFGGQGVVGRYAGAMLRQLPARIVSWAEFGRRHPAGLVLTRRTGFGRPYGQNPYIGYDQLASPALFGSAHASDRRLQPKERVVLIEQAGEAVAVPFASFLKRRSIEVKVGGKKLGIRVTGTVTSALDQAVIADSRELPSVEVLDEQGRPVAFSEPFWFAVAAFRPRVVLVR